MAPPIFDPSTVLTKIVLKLTDEQGYLICTAKQFMKTITSLLKACTEGGGFTLENLPITFEDKEDPYILYTLIAFLPSGYDVTATVLVRKVDMYLLAYKFSKDADDPDENKKWQVTSDYFKNNVLNLKHGTYEDCGFRSTYVGGGPVQIDYNVGLRVLVNALSRLRDGDRAAFIILCHMLGEATRYVEVAKFIQRTMKMSNELSQVLPEKLILYLNEWDKASVAQHGKHLPEGKKLKDKDNKIPVMTALGCVKKESPLVKKLRMEEAIKNHGEELKRTLVNKSRKHLNPHELFIKGLVTDIGHVFFERKFYQGDKLSEAEIEVIGLQWEKKGGNAAIWKAILNAAVHPKLYIAQEILNGSPIFIFGNDMSRFVDYQGNVYEPPEDDMIKLRTGKKKEDVKKKS